MNVIGISGSLRKGSFNTAALRAAQGLAPEGMTIEVAQIGDLPLYNDDVRAAGFPPPAERLRAQLAAAASGFAALAATAASALWLASAFAAGVSFGSLSRGSGLSLMDVVPTVVCP